MRKVFVVGDAPSIKRMFVEKEGYCQCLNIDDADIVCFIGGSDVNPCMYQEQRLKETYVNLQCDQRDILAWGRAKNKFKVGICRGAQFLNVKSGGALWQDVNNHAISGNHLAIDLLFTQDILEVTSTHHQMMIAGEDGEILAIANEATKYKSANKDRKPPSFDTEVVWYESTNSLCFQPHPEYQHTPKECKDYFFDLIDFFYEDKEDAK